MIWQELLLAHLCCMFAAISTRSAQPVWECCRAELRQAGSYAVRVGTQGHMLPGWPQALHVQPCAADAAQCWLSGAALQVCSISCCLAVRDALPFCDWGCTASTCAHHDAMVPHTSRVPAAMSASSKLLSAFAMLLLFMISSINIELGLFMKE